jgi:hypothetical protein
MNSYLETHEEACFINNGYHQPRGNDGWNTQGNSNPYSNFNSNQPSLRDLVLGQIKTIENLHRKKMNNDRIFENFNAKIEHISSFIRNQLRFNITIETQLVQIAAAIPINNMGRVPGQPKKSPKYVHAATDK